MNEADAGFDDCRDKTEKDNQPSWCLLQMTLIRGELVWGLHRYAQFSLGHVDLFRQYLLEDELVILRETKSNWDRSNRNPNGFFFNLFLKAVLAYLFSYFWLSVLEFLLNILWHIYLFTVVLII